jgi:hypothetical protein
LNTSYIPIGGAILLAIKKNGSRSLPMTTESQLFDSDLKSSDHLHAIGWNIDNTNVQFLIFDDGNRERILMSTNLQQGINDLGRLKTLCSLMRGDITMSQACLMSKIRFTQSIKEDHFQNNSDKVSTLLYLEAKCGLRRQLSEMEEYSMIKMIDKLKDESLNLYRMAAQVDSMPVVMNNGSHLCFLPEEISIVSKL